MPDSTFSLDGKLVFLRLSRLGRLPPALAMAEILAETGFPVLAVEYGNLHESATEVPGPVPRLRIPSPRAGLLPAKLKPIGVWGNVAAQLLTRILKGERPRLILAEGIQEQAMALFLSQVSGIPFSVHVHEVHEAKELSPINRIFLSLEGPALRAAGFLVFPESTRVALYRERYRFTAPTYLIANCPRLRQKGNGKNLRASLGIPENDLLMAYAGGIGPTNMIEEGIRALALNPRIHFLIWGWGERGYVDSLLEAAREAGVESRVRFLGELDADKWDCLDGCDLGYCVYRAVEFRLKHSATASNKLMESFAAGLPVVTNGNPDYRGLVEKWDVGVAADSLEPKDIAAALDRLTRDELGFRRKARNARELHENCYHYELQLGPLLPRLRTLFGNPEPAQANPA